MNGTSEVKSKVELEFITPNNKRMAVVRLLEGIKKGDKYTTSQIDASIIKKDEKSTSNNSTTNKSSKVKDVNSQMIKYMGVSEEMLNTVIFCHQEEVNWPLNLKNDLKDRLEDIFSTKKYSNLLSELLDVKKKRESELKVLQKELEHNETYKTEFENISRELNDQFENINEILTNIQQLSDETKYKETRIDELKLISNSMKQLQKEIESKNIHKMNIKNSLKEIKSKININEIKETTEELLELLKNYDGLISKTQNEINEKEDFKKHKINDKNKIIVEMQRINADIIELEVKKTNSIEILNSLIYELQSYFNESSDNKSWEYVDQSLDRIQLNLNNLEDRKKIELKEKNSIISSFQNSLDDLRKKIGTLLGEISSSELKISQLNQSINKINSELKNNEENIISEKLSLLEMKKNKLQDTKLQMNFEERISAIQNEIEKEKNIRSDVNIQIELRSKEEKIQNDIKSLENDIFRINTQLSNDLKEINESISKFCNLSSFSINESQILVESRQESLIEEKKLLHKNHDQFSNEINRINIELNRDKTQLNDLEKTKSKVVTTLQNYSQTVDKYESFLEEIEQEYEDSRNQFELENANMKIVQNIKSHAQRHHKCPTCERSLNNDEMVNFVQIQDFKINNSQTSSNKVSELKLKLDKIKNLKNDINELNKIQILKDNIKKLEEQISILNEKKEINNNLIKQNDINSQEGTRIWKYITSKLIPSINEIKRKNNQIDEAKSQLKNEIYEKSLEELKSEVTISKGYSNKLKLELDSLLEKKDSLQKEIENCNAEYIDLLNKFNDIEKKRIDLKSKEFELKQITDSLIILNNNLAPLKIEEEKLKTDYENKRNLLSELESSLNNEITNISMIYNKFINRKQDAKKFSEINEKDLEQLNIKKKYLEEEFNSLEKEIDHSSEFIDKRKELLSNSSELKRKIKDSIDYKEKMNEYKNISDEIKKYELKLSKKGDLIQIEREIQELEKQKSNLNLEISKLKGKKETIDNFVEGIQNNLQKENLAFAYRNYNNILIKFSTTKTSIEDLIKYHKALEEVILQYHQRKLDEINYILKNLWQKTYRGHDIDYIAIRAKRKGNLNKYKYNLIMRKGDIEIEMNGMCSTGQKVLASLIVRLALAEAFSSECGIMTLDEPTVSLDKENVRSLAESLQILMQERRNTNFQLVVITHDEDFVQRLGRSEFVDFYYKVSKDSHGNSIITQEKFLG